MWPTSRKPKLGLLVTIRCSKTDQEGEGATIAIARGDVACPARLFWNGWMRRVSRQVVYLRRDLRPSSEGLAHDLRGPWRSTGEEHSRADQGLSGKRDEWNARSY
jgi:hypothetical protein